MSSAAEGRDTPAVDRSTSRPAMAAEGAAAQPPRYAGPVGAWPDGTLSSLLTVPHMLDPRRPDLLQDAAQRAEAQQIVGRIAADPEALAHVRSLLAQAPRHFSNNDHEFARSSLALSSDHGVSSPAAQLLTALLQHDPRAFDAGEAPAAALPLRTAPSPKKRQSVPSASRSATRRRTGTTQPAAQEQHEKGPLVAEGEVEGLKVGDKLWLRWDDPKGALHDKWLPATVGAHASNATGQADDEWSGYFVLQFENQQIDMAGKAFDLKRYANLERLRYAVAGASLVQQSPKGGGAPTVSPTPTAGAKKRSTKRQHVPMAISTDSVATVTGRLRKHIDGLLDRAPQYADQLSSSGDHEAVITASDTKQILADVLSLKASNSKGHGRIISRDDAQNDNADDVTTSVWGIEAKEWHTVLLVLDRFIQAGINLIEAGASNESLGYLDAALIVLHIATLADRPQELLISETIDTVLLAAKRVLDCIVFPVFIPSSVRPDQQQPSAASGTKSSPAKIAPKSPARSKTSAAVGAANSVSQVLHQLSALCQKESLEDGMICSLSSLGISTIATEGAEMVPLQGSSVQLLCTLAKRYRTHREMVFNEAFEFLPKLSGTAKKNVRQFRVSDDVSIQTISALFLGLFQASVGAPPIPSSTTLQSEWDKSRTDYEEAQSIAKIFLSKFIKKCLVKKDDGDVRVVLERFIVDMCAVLNWPAWPAAESALRTLALMMTHELKTPQVNAVKAADSSYRGFLIDMVGTITCVVCKQCNAESTADVLTEGENDDDEDDRAARVRSMQQQMVISYALGNDGRDAVPFLLNLWLAEGDAAAENRQQQLSGLLGDESRPSTTEDTVDPVQAASLQLALSRQFLKMKPVLLERIVAMFQDTNITLRSKAMKVLSNLVEECESIFADEKVKAAVKKNLYDAAVSVREAAVDMVGKVMALNSAHSNSYLELVIERSFDTGKSVRKRCVRILYETLCAQPLHSASTKILLTLVSRSDDEDSIREIVLGAFRDLWFNPEVRAMSVGQIALQTDMSRQSGAGNDGVITCDVPFMTLAQRVKQMLDCMAVSSAPERSRLVNVFNALLGRSDREGDTRRPFGHMATMVSVDQIKELCGKMCDQLIDVLLRADEEDAEHDDAEDVVPAQTPGSRVAVRTCCILAMHIFCQAGAEFLVDHMTTLQPYLKLPRNASKDDCIMVQYAAYMIYECLPIAQTLDQTFKEALANDLLAILKDSGHLQVLHVSVKCLCALFEHALSNDKMLRNVLQHFLKLLTRTVDKLTTGGENFELPAHACRSLFILGCLCRHYGFDEDGQQKQVVSASNSMTSLVVAVCLRCSVPESSEAGRKFAIGALGHIACRKPNLLLQDEPQEVMEVAMAEGSSCTIKQQVLKSLSEVLVDEERKNMLKSGSKASRTGKKFTETADDSKVKTDEMGLTGGLMQRYLAQLLSLSHDNNADVRLDALNLIRVILRQGLVHPMECVAHVVALTGDQEPRVRAQAEKMVAYLDEKHHSLLVLRSVEGVLKSYEFQRRVFETESAFVPQKSGGNVCAFRQLYSSLQSKKSESKQFVTSLLNKIVDSIKDLSNHSQLGQAARVDLCLLSYIVSVLSALPFSKKEEIMTILSALTRSISLYGEPLELALSEAMCAETQSDGTGAAAEPQVTSAAAHLLRPVQHKCIAATVVCMLIQLKSYIQNCYGISNHQITLYMDAPTGGRLDAQIIRRTEGLFKLSGDIELKQPVGAAEDDSVLWSRYSQLKAALQDDGAQAELILTSGQAGSPNGSHGGRASALKRGRGAATKGKSPKGAKAAKKKKKKKRRKRLSDLSESESDDPSDDSDFEG